MSSAYFTIDAKWLGAAATGICARNGIILKDALSQAEQGSAVQILNDRAVTLSHLLRTAHASLEAACDDFLRQNARNLRLTRASHPTPAIESLNKVERASCRELIVRVAITGALVQYQRRTRRCVLKEETSSSLSAAPQTSVLGNGTPDTEVTDELLERSLQTTLLKGLLYAFEAFQECHSMNRDHYPPRADNNTPGTVGWDTLVLLYLVHRVPQVARHASGRAIDESIGQIIRTWRKLFIALQSIDPEEAPEHSRRRGALSLVNGLLIILFQRYNTHQCGVLLGAVEHAERVAENSKEPARSILHPSRHMVSEVVTFLYYRGRMQLYERKLSEAHQTLREAYTLLPPAGFGNEAQRLNKERVRFFLTVAGVANGRRIPAEIEQADAVLLPSLFGPLVCAIECGDPVRFSTALACHASTFHRRGVYLILQQAKILCFLMVVARVHAAMGSLPGVDNSRITIATLLAAYSYITSEGAKEPPLSDEGPLAASWQGKKKRIREAEPMSPNSEARLVDIAMDEDRMTLWVAKLIARGYVRGYYSHEHKTLVLSKKAPFPLLQEQG